MLTNKIKLNYTLKTGNAFIVSHLSGQSHIRKTRLYGLWIMLLLWNSGRTGEELQFEIKRKKIKYCRNEVQRKEASK